MDQLIFNSYYRSANVFLCLLAKRMINYPATTNHDPKLYSEKSNKNVVMFRNPYDAIASSIVKRRTDGGSPLPTIDNSFGIEGEISILAQEYLDYAAEAQKNFDNIYIGNFERMIEDPYLEMKKIAKFFKLTLNDEFDKSFEEAYAEIEEEMHNTSNEIQPTLMTSHDGHLPREKTESRLIVEKYVNDSNLSLLKDCYQVYETMKYTVLSDFLNTPRKTI